MIGRPIVLPYQGVCALMCPLNLNSKQWQLEVEVDVSLSYRGRVMR
jgi:hypothetical protein